MSVTAARGFRAAGVAAGLKSSGAPDLALVVNDGPDHHGAAVFTSNRVEAAPVTWSRQVASDGRVDAVVLNSGGANACTGAQGFADTHATAEKVADVLGVSAGDVVVCSTGLSGELLPMPSRLEGVERAAAALTPEGGVDAATAIETTDTVHKVAAAERDGWTVGGMAKGAGMLAPALATMLVVVTTDAVVTPGELDGVLRAATALTFDRIDSDGCQSTNATVLLLASGASGVAVEPADLTSAVTDDLARPGDRGGLDPVAGEHCRAVVVRAVVDDECEVRVSAGLEAGDDAGRPETLRCGHAHEVPPESLAGAAVLPPRFQVAIASSACSEPMRIQSVS